MTGLVVDILDLPPAIGATKQIHLDLLAPEDLGTELIGAEPGSPLVVDATLASMEDGVLVRVTAAAPAPAEARRLLAPVVAAAKDAIGEEYIKYVEED